MKKIIITLIVILFSCLLLVMPFLIKVNIDCRSQYGTCPKEVTDKINLFNGKSLFTARNSVSKILKSDFLVSGFSLQFRIPNILQTEVLVKKPVIAFKDNGSDYMILVDTEGKVLSEASDSALPTITGITSLSGVGQKVSDKDIFALNLANGVYQMYQVRDFTVQDDSLLVELPGQIRVIFPLDGDSQILLGSLRLIYSKIQNEGNPEKYSQIDLRFKNPVLR